MRFTIVGSGAIGGTVGAYLARGGEDVEFVDQLDEHVAAMRQRGLTIKAYSGTFTQAVNAMTPAELTGSLDVVLLAVKAQHTESAVRELLPHLSATSVVVSLQNGLCEEIIATLIGPQRTIGAFINYNADYLEPGVIHYGGPGAFFVGEVEGAITPRVEEIVRRLRHWGDVQATDNILGFLWSKLGYANMLYATAVIDEPMAEVLNSHRPLMVELACEVYEAATLEAIKLEPFDNVEPYVYFPRESQNWGRINASLDVLVALMRTSEKQRSGVWRDLAVRRRKTEVDFHLGAAAAAGKEHGLPMPLTNRLVRIIHELESAERTMGQGNIEELEGLLAASPSRNRG